MLIILSRRAHARVGVESILISESIIYVSRVVLILTLHTILTFFFFTEIYSCPELRNLLRPTFCQLAGFLVRFLVGVLPVLGQPIGSTEEPVEGLVVEEPELELDE